MAHLMQVLLTPLRLLAEARGLLFPWVAVFIGCGIGLWFSLPFEPDGWFYAAMILVLLASTFVHTRGSELLHPVTVLAGCVAFGMLAAGARVHLQAAPMLDFRYFGPVKGRIVEIDRSSTDSLRLTLDQVVLDRVGPARTPARVRVALKGDQRWLVPEPGQVVITTASLAAPDGPVEPGGFDFRRMAYFRQLGAVGYTQSAVLLWSPPERGAQSINRLRTRLAAAVMQAIPGDSGAFAAGVMTGDRSGLSLDAVEALRDSSLAHLLAISGMNMAFLAGFVFALVRYGIALIPPVALRLNSKKLAALVALGVALFYLLLSGANVATERAFVMSSVMLVAVLLDRRALTLRTVALSAIVILMLQPESLLDPGFQMSFAATTALIAGFRQVEGQMVRGRLPKWSMPVFTLVLSSVIAGFATAPYAAANFNRYAEYGLLANLLTVPVMGAVVMPAGAVAALLAPFGLADLPLWVMKLGCDWILFTAHWIAGLDGAVTSIPTPGAWVVPLITLGGIWIIVWIDLWRWLGVVAMILGAVLWFGTERPVLLIASDGALVGVMGPEGRALSKSRGGGFAAQTWLENDGDLASQKDAAARPGLDGPRGERRFHIGDTEGIVLTGAATETAPDACATTPLVILAAKATGTGPCLMIDTGLLDQTGPIAVWPEGPGLRLQPTHRAARVWSPHAPAPEGALVWQPLPTELATAQ